MNTTTFNTNYESCTQMSTMTQTELSKRIAVSEENYRRIKEYGRLGDTFNDVITRLLEEAKEKGSKR